MAKTAHVSKTVLSEAAGGIRPPTWPTVNAYLSALGIVDPNEQSEWHERWSAMRMKHAALFGNPTTTPGALPDPAKGEEAGDRPQDHGQPRRRLPVLIIGGAVVAAALLFPTLRSSNVGTTPPEHSASARSPIGIVVSNMIAVGADALIEDSTPAYLSTEPLPYCARRGCKVPGTEMWSGAILDVTCVVEGAWMTNYNLDADAVTANPNRYSSSLWYRGTTADRYTIGYLSEIYISPEYRGGLGLPVCASAPHPTTSG